MGRLAGSALPVRLLVFGLCSYALAELGRVVSNVTSGPLQFWPPAGLLLAALLVSPTRVWWVLVVVAGVGYLPSDLRRGITPLLSLELSVGQALGALAGASMIRRFATPNLSLSRTTPVPLPLLVAGAFGAAIIDAALKATVTLGSQAVGGTWLRAWQDYSIGHLLGNLLIAPVILTWGARPLATRARPRLVEAASLALTSIACAWLAFGPFDAFREVFLSALVPCLVWTAVRFGIRGTAWLGLFVGLVTVWATDHAPASIGPSASPLQQHGRSLQLFVIVTLSTALLLASALEERQRVALELRHSQQALKRIADVSRTLVGDLDFDGIARVVARSVDGGVLVALIDGEGNLIVRACATVDPAWESYLSAFVGQLLPVAPGTPAAESLRTGRPALLGREAAGRLNPAFAKIAADVGSLVMVPLVVDARPIGAVAVFRMVRLRPFGPDDVPLLAEIGDRAAVALARTRLAEEKRRTSDRLELLADAGRLLGQSLEVLPTMTSVARLAVQWFADTCGLWLWGREGIVDRAVEARDPLLGEKVILAMEPYLDPEGPRRALRPILEFGQAILIPEVDEAALRRLAMDDAHLALVRAVGMRSLIVVPLLTRHVSVGVVAFIRTGGRAYDEDDRSCAEEFGRRAAIAIDNARLFRAANEAIAVRDDFLSIASHELNTPLTPLKMQIDSLRRRQFSPEHVREKLDAAAGQVARLTKVVTQLLDVSRIRAGRLPIVPEAFDMAELVDEVVARMSYEAERSGVPLVAHAERPCPGTWDRIRIDQVVTDLVTNAVRYGAGQPVEITLSKTDSGVRIAVRDQGIGIAPENQQRIFERFERASSSRHYGGFGLGLWIAREILRSSGGTISVDSAPGRGSTFVVELPFQPPPCSPR
jgi:signal transduction histidine kinase/integral membrane sensor domain MASE1